VLVLTEDNFHRVVATRDPILVEFYAPWCGHCKTLAPEYSEAAKQLKEFGIPIAKLDATEAVAIGKEFDVSGYPTIKLFRKGEPSEDYDGGRTAADIVTYMRRVADPDYVPPPTAVLDLTDDTAKEVIESTDLLLLEFYAPWCGHCKKIAPEYETAANILKGHPVTLAKVDATVHTKIAEEYGVKGYPTLKVFRRGREFEYKGGRESSTIVSYMKEQMLPPSQEVRTIVSAKNALPRASPILVGSFSSEEDPLYMAYTDAAHSLRGDMAMMHTFSEAVATHLGLTKAPSITVLMPKLYTGDSDRTLPANMVETPVAADIVAWVRTSSTPRLGERSMSNEGVLYSAKPLVVVYGPVDFGHDGYKATQIIRKKVLPLTHKYPDMTFALSDEDAYAKEMESVGLGDTGEDLNAVIFADDGRYPMPPSDDFEDDFAAFLANYPKGRLTPHIKSEPVPKRQSGAVVKLVGKTAAKLDSSKAYFIEFYAPWCGHCKKLAPVYEQLGAHYSADERVVVAKLDATANDVPPLFPDVTGFPTLYWRGSAGAVSKFEGDRTLQAMREFIDEQLEKEGSARDEL